MNINGPTSFHERFNTAIKSIAGLCQKKLEGPNISSISKNFNEWIVSLCKKYNNSICSMHGHDKRVIARACQSYKKNINNANNPTKINNKTFNKKIADANFIQKSKGKNLKAFNTTLKNDSILKELSEKFEKNNIKQQITISKNDFIESLKLCNTESKIPNTQKQFIELFSKTTLTQEDIGTIQGNQVFKDLKRGYQFEFVTKNGEKIEIKNNEKNIQTLSDIEIFKEIQNQIKKKGLTSKDKEVLADFLANHTAQGIFATVNPNLGQCLNWEGNNLPLFIINHKNDQTSITVKTNGSKQNSYCINGNACKANVETNAEVVFIYPKSIGECKCKASNIEVKRFEQEIGDITVF